MVINFIFKELYLVGNCLFINYQLREEEDILYTIHEV